MKKFLYGAIYLFVLAMIFSGFLTEVAGSMGIDLPTNEIVLISNNGGKEWKQPRAKGETINGGNFFFNAEDPSKIFLASNNEIFQIQNEETINKNAELKKTLGAGYVSEFIQDPASPNIFYLISSGIEKSSLFISHDYGESFESVFTANNDDKISVFKINPIDDSYLYIGTQNGLFLVSDNGGLSWKKKKNFSPSPIKEIAISGIDGEIYISLSSKIINLFSPESAKKIEPAVYLSIDGGNSFSAMKKLNGFQVNKIVPDDSSGNIYFVSDYKIFVSRENKISSLNLLSSISGERIGAFTINPKNPNILYMGVDDILYKTNDKGNSWSTINIPISGRKISDIKINEENSNIILLSLAN